MFASERDVTMFGTAKLVSLFIIFTLSLISGVLSLVAVRCLLSRLGSSDRFKKVISVLNCFSGGVFLATSILHLLPEARESMEHAKEHFNLKTEYPLTELLLGVGFLLVLTIEHAAHFCCHVKTDTTKIQNASPAVPKQASKPCSLADDSLLKSDSVKPNEQAILIRNDFEDSSYVDDITYQNYGTVDASLDKTSIRPYGGVLSRDGTPCDTVLFGNSDKVVIRTTPGKTNLGIKPSLSKVFQEPEEDQPFSRLRGLTLMIALSLHMVFDGLALGLLQEENQIWQLLAALSLHKVLVFMTIGLQALEILKSIKKAILVLVIFALVSPCGIVIGESINSTGDEISRDTASAILQGLATGTFLFVTFFEILLKELGNDHHNILKVIVTTIGFVLVAVFRVLDQEGD